MIKNALIIGATGLVGKELTALLIRTDYYNSLHIVGRRPYTFEHPKIRSHIIDFDRMETFAAEALIHDVYICLGTTMKRAGSKETFRKVDHDYVLAVAQWAGKHNVEKLACISSMGANPHSSNFYLRTKGEVENDLAGIKLPRLIFLRPSLLLGKREEFRFAEKLSSILMSPMIPLMRGPLKKYIPVKASQVAKAMFHLTLNATQPVQIVENLDIVNLTIY